MGDPTITKNNNEANAIQEATFKYMMDANKKQMAEAQKTFWYGAINDEAQSTHDRVVSVFIKSVETTSAHRINDRAKELDMAPPYENVDSSWESFTSQNETYQAEDQQDNQEFLDNISKPPPKGPSMDDIQKDIDKMDKKIGEKDKEIGD